MANLGIEAPPTDIIVRLDANAISEPAHVGRLVAALDEDPELRLVGSAVMLTADCAWTIPFHCPFHHWTTIALRALTTPKTGAGSARASLPACSPFLRTERRTSSRLMRDACHSPRAEQRRLR
ncbi:hypothetical protein IG197_14015 [Aminobacter sp. SR38]|jgi:hypothetical protein|uniref:hypothetical protein n=1 Tax=Aminobacter sp. SR38 TaxID=2774562 RepID=UPI001782E1B8|nr:hypothetical protein [Aminobacter sp. SR38]QOF69026.1 hypothetical protein IG197_14015 [Aminobacter sp. SR38]